MGAVVIDSDVAASRVRVWDISNNEPEPSSSIEPVRQLLSQQFEALSKREAEHERALLAGVEKLFEKHHVIDTSPQYREGWKVRSVIVELYEQYMLISSDLGARRLPAVYKTADTATCNVEDLVRTGSG